MRVLKNIKGANIEEQLSSIDMIIDTLSSRKQTTPVPKASCTPFNFILEENGSGKCFFPCAGTIVKLVLSIPTCDKETKLKIEYGSSAKTITELYDVKKGESTIDSLITIEKYMLVTISFTLPVPTAAVGLIFQQGE